MDINYNKKLNEILKNIDINNKPNLFLHICCGPCSTQVLKRLNNYFNIFIIFYNPNIDTKEEFDKRYNELSKIFKFEKYNICILYNDYNHYEFLDNIAGFENEPERGRRCEVCYNIRLNKSYNIAREYIIKNSLQDKINYLCTTLSISPYKNATMIEKIGEKICNADDSYIKYLPSDFKKENGYLKSIELSRKYGLYRQNYCGCEFSKNA